MTKATIAAFVAVAALVTVSNLGANATPNPVPSYPSAAEVAAAKKKVASKKAMIKRLEAIIVDLMTQADAAEKIAQVKGEAYSIARDAYQAKAAQVASLQSQADAAMAKANAALTELGQIAGQMYRDGSGGTSLNLFLNAGKASDCAYFCFATAVK